MLHRSLHVVSACLFGLALGAIARPVSAQAADETAAPDTAVDARPVVRAVWTDVAPVVDGDIGDAAWHGAADAGGFVERKPILRSTPPVETTFRILYDAQAMYVRMRCDDPEPEGILGHTRARDKFDIFRDDAVSLKIDVASDRRTTLGFVVNPVGGRMDYRAINEGGFRPEIDVLWDVAAQRTDTGWVAEFRLPWASLGVDTSAPPARIGFNISRDHPRRNATYDWALMPPPFSAVSASLYGDLVGLERLAGQAGAGDSAPPLLTSWFASAYGLGGFNRAEGSDGQVHMRGLYNAGLDAGVELGRWKGQLTLNTDFAQVDLDSQIVNLGRFSVFLPEKRDFFLRDAELFTFGRAESSQLVHTRTIGLSGGAEVPILTGLKVIGRPHDAFRLGVLQVTTRSGAGQPWTSHLVTRGQLELGGGSNVGLLYTHRQSLEDSDDRNVVIGVDGAWRGSGTPVLVEAFGALSVDNEPGGRQDDVAGMAGVSARWRGELFRPKIDYTFIDEDFEADLGFIRRRDLHSIAGTLEIEPRMTAFGLEKINLRTTASVLLDGSGTDLLDWSTVSEAQLTWAAGWWLGFNGVFGSELVTSDFEVGESTVIEAGRYDSLTVNAWGGTPGTRVVSASVSLKAQDYYGGTLLGASGSMSMRPIDRVRLDVSAGFNHVEFDDERAGFDTLVVNSLATFGITNDLSATLQVGYNGLLDLMQLKTRLRWSYLPGSDIFLVYQLDLGIQPTRERFQSLLVKMTFRYPWD